MGEAKTEVPRWVATGKTVWTGGQAWATCDTPGQAARVAEDMNAVELYRNALEALRLMLQARVTDERVAWAKGLIDRALGSRAETLPRTSGPYQHTVPTNDPEANRLLDALNDATADVLKEAGLTPRGQ